MDIDSNGIAWLALASGQMASFDRKLCKGPLNGPLAATGKACPEGWKLYSIPGPQFKGVAMKGGSAESPYYDWVDQFDTLGLGKNVPIATGNNSDALFALVDAKWVTMRVPYPWASSRRTWTVALTMRTLVGRQGHILDLFRPLAPHIEGGKASRARSCTSAQAQPLGGLSLSFKSSLKAGVTKVIPAFSFCFTLFAEPCSRSGAANAL